MLLFLRLLGLLTTSQTFLGLASALGKLSLIHVDHRLKLRLPRFVCHSKQHFRSQLRAKCLLVYFACLLIQIGGLL